MLVTIWAITKNIKSKLNKTKNRYVKKSGDLGHVAPLPPKKPSKSVISSSMQASYGSPGASAGASSVWSSGQSPGHATSALN